jgi:5-hydroxyisourate hydrolase
MKLRQSILFAGMMAAVASVGVSLSSSISVAATINSATAERNPLSVHVLNLQTGTPPEGVEVVLEQQQQGKWVKLNSATTDSDGRIRALYPEGKQITPGNYKVTFQTGAYFATLNQTTLFPEVPVIIHVAKHRAKEGEHYHVPLLLSQYGYSTYRGN